MTAETKPLVGVLGLKKDRKLLEITTGTLEDWGASYDLQTFTKRNTFKFTSEYAESAIERGLNILITSDRADNCISKIAAPRTRLPVIAIPTMDMTELPNPNDSLNYLLRLQEFLTIYKNATDFNACLPGGINEAGAINAGLMAVAFLALKNPRISERLDAFRAKQTEDILNIKLPRFTQEHE